MARPRKNIIPYLDANPEEVVKALIFSKRKDTKKGNRGKKKENKKN